MELFKELSNVILYLGIMAFLVSVVTEVLKKWEWLRTKVPTALVVIAVSLILCPVSLIAVLMYFGLVITWYMVFASFIAAFIVAMIAMDGWERVTELAGRMIKK